MEDGDSFATDSTPQDTVDTTPNTSDESNNEAKENFRKATEFVDNGLKLISEGSYQEAVDHLSDPDFAKKFGLVFSSNEARVTLYDGREDELYLRQVQDTLAANSKTAYSKGVGAIIKPSKLFNVTFTGGRETIHPVPDILNQEQALLHAEEWLHGLQSLHHGNLTEAPDHESDIAFYLTDKGVPLTEAFLDRYNRRDALKNRTPTQGES